MASYDGLMPPLAACHSSNWCVMFLLSCTHTHPFNGPFYRTTRVGRYQKGKTNLGFTEARDSEWQWHQLGHMQVCISLQTDNHASTSPLSFLQAGCPSCRPTNSVKALLSYLVNKLTLALSHCEPLWLNWTWCNNSTIKLIQANHNYCITNSIIYIN